MTAATNRLLMSDGSDVQACCVVGVRPMAELTEAVEVLLAWCRTCSARSFLAGYGRALAAAILAAVIFLLLPVMPFTEQYARESVPREFWHSPTFRSINRRISAAWGGAIAVMALSHVVAGMFATPDSGAGLLHRPVDLLFNWIVPALLLWAAARYTQRVAGDDQPAEPARSRASRQKTR
jgi:hypothetical protein